MQPKDADGMANRVDPDWTAPFVLSVQIFRITMVIMTKLVGYKKNTLTSQHGIEILTDLE